MASTAARETGGLLPGLETKIAPSPGPPPWPHVLPVHPQPQQWRWGLRQTSFLQLCVPGLARPEDLSWEDALHTLWGLAMGFKLRLAGTSVTFRNTVVKITVKLKFMGLPGDLGNERPAPPPTCQTSETGLFSWGISPLSCSLLCVHGEGRWCYRNMET